MKKIISVLCFVFIGLTANSQNPDSVSKVYKIYPFIDLPIIAVGAIANPIGLEYVRNKTPLDSAVVVNLGPNDVNWFDRPATWQSVDFTPTAEKISDWGVNVSIVLPALLFLDKDIRSEWLSVIVLYVESHMVTANLYTYGAARFIDRARPLVYNSGFPLEQRTGANTMNSFFSGHTSTSATSSFFMAKVYCDFHPELGNKKFLIYSLAVIPPAFTGFFRFKASRHFATDVIAGILVGGGVGILIPHLHKRKPIKNLTIVPYTGHSHGVALTYKF
jgi:membrane-associated phospholipid phosphatase